MSAMVRAPVEVTSVSVSLRTSWTIGSRVIVIFSLWMVFEGAVTEVRGTSPMFRIVALVLVAVVTVVESTLAPLTNSRLAMVSGWRVDHLCELDWRGAIWCDKEGGLREV